MGTQKIIITAPSENQDGFVLVVALMMLAVLSVVGIVALNSTDIELQIAGNDRQEKQIFYGTESGCMRGGQWLRNLQLVVIDDYVDSDLLTTYIAPGTSANRVHVIETGESNLNLDDDAVPDATVAYPVNYWYAIQESESDDGSGDRVDCRPIPGNNPNMLECYFDVECSAVTSTGGARKIAIQVDKPTDFN